MATTTHPVAVASKSLSATRHNPLALWHLLSLDAPTVAALWTWFLASQNHIHLPAAAVVAMFLTVWILYAADRLLDARIIHKTPGAPPIDPLLHAMGGNDDLESSALFTDNLEPRHHFHRLHQRAFRVGIFLAAAALAFLLPNLAPQAIRLYLILSALLIAYFFLIHTDTAHRLPKEIAVGIFFSAATFIPTISRQPALRTTLLPAALLFATICSLNCLFIYAWEHPTSTPSTHPATRLALRFLPILTIAAVICGFTLALADRQLPWPIPICSALSPAFLLLLHRARLRFSPTTLRAAADLCLLTPLLFLLAR